jgi:V8-like Glu-specific endopeptidase
MLLVISNAFALEKSLCSATDERVRSFDKRIGRLFIKDKHKGCTATLISKNCVITAGHCSLINAKIEFIVPKSSQDGTPTPSDEANIYDVINESIIFEHDSKIKGMDWAVLKLAQNSYSNLYPGEVYGHYSVDLRKKNLNRKISVTGFGKSLSNSSRSYTQQSHNGLAKLSKTGIIRYKVDTTTGTSGAALIDLKSQKVIGIHTHGGCTTKKKSNRGVLLYSQPKLKKAIQSCLDSYSL